MSATMKDDVSEFKRNGYLLVSGLLTEREVDLLDSSLCSVHRRLENGELDESWCGTGLNRAADGPKARSVHYVRHVTKLSEPAAMAFANPTLIELIGEIIGPHCWPLDFDEYGVLYQVSRPGQESGYSRIGWHTDEQSRPGSEIWPGVAVTFHLDPTSPANGFLRLVPGSHTRDGEMIPTGFGKVAGEMGLYCDRGDVLLHHSRLWHSAAQATEEPPRGIRRHMRGSYYGGRKVDAGHLGTPVASAAR
jgi:hypothetical protein